jgi:predicted nucleotidyltransferase
MNSTQRSRTRKADEPLASVLASKALAAVVIYFVLHPDRALHFRALQRVTRVSSRSLQHEIARLEALGMVRRERDGRLVRYRAVAGHPRWSVLRQMIREFAHPAEVLRVALAEVSGIEAAFIFGSFARGDTHAESDVDVFVLSDRMDYEDDRLDLAEATLESSALLNREVNAIRYTPEKLARRSSGGFLRSVLAGSKMWLVGDHTVLECGEEVL